MRTYIGQTRSHKLIAELDELGFGECVNRGEYTPRRTAGGWFLDNGAYADFKQGREFDADEYRAMFARVADAPAPDFIVAPDVVAGGTESLELSLAWLDECRALALATWGEAVPVYCVIQDGMSAEDVDAALWCFDGLFVGGTTDWKFAAAPGIIARANGGGSYVDSCPPPALPKPVHIGRVGSGRRYVYARTLGADSVDSCVPLRERRKLELAVDGTAKPLPEAAVQFPAGVKMAAEATDGFARRAYLRGELDEDVGAMLRAVGDLAGAVHDARFTAVSNSG
jgi:hypothetical protein